MQGLREADALIWGASITSQGPSPFQCWGLRGKCDLSSAKLWMCLGPSKEGYLASTT